MGSKSSKKKKKDDDGEMKKQKRGKNTPRHFGSTASLTETNLRNVVATPNPYADRSKLKPPPPPPTPLQAPEKPKLPVVKAMYDYQSRYDDDISFKQGDKMEVIDRDNESWWLVKKIDGKEKGYVPSNYIALDDNSIETQEWWFGSDRREANKQLMLPGNPTGTFLIRNSKERNAYALSLLDKDEKGDIVIRHYLIRKMDNGGCFIQAKKTFSDIFELVNYYTAQCGGLKCRLTKPCPKQALAVPFKDLEVRRTDIVLGDRLGAGNFGEVHAGTFRNVVDVAVKSLKQGSMTTDQFLAEAQMMHNLRHPKLVQLMGVCTEGQPVWIITERMVNGALIDFLRKDFGKTITFATMIDMAAQIAAGMSYLEEKRFIHRDLRAANILVGENFIVKVADFGLARVLDSIYEDEDEVYKTDANTKFPVKWTAPEASSDFEFSIKSDVWSYGILLYELVTYGRIPYPDMDNAMTMTRVRKGYRMPKPDGENVVCPKEIYDIMTNCWNAKPELRPTFEHLKCVFEDFQVFAESNYTGEEY